MFLSIAVGGRRRGICQQIYRILVVLLILSVGTPTNLRAGTQVQTFPRDTLPLPLLTDSLAPASAPDSSRIVGSTAQFRSSADSLNAPVIYSSRDSTIINIRSKEIHLYGEAQVDYQQISLRANHIVLNYGTNIVVAEPWPDSSGVATGKPRFSDGGQEFEAGSMRYNFKSRKGIVYETVTTQDDVYVRGGKSKFISGAVATSDSTTADVIYTEGAIFTTCSADHPHFGIRTRKAKVVPNKLAVIGPSNLEIMGVPTPLWLPFGFFPLKSGRSSGLLFPSDWQYSPNLGFGAQGIGWFFPLGDHVNLQLTADYYLKGAYRLQGNSTYSRRYKYQGSFNASFSNLRREDGETLQEIRDKGVTVRWSHRQDRRAHPTFNFGGNINFQTNQIDQRFINSYDVASRNVIRSSMNMTKTFPGIKSTLTAGFNHSQSNATEQITVNFPDARFQTQTIYPLRNSGSANPRAWYKKLSFQYQSALRTEFNGPADNFFSDSTLQAGQYGFRHQVTSALSLNVLKYFNVSPNVTYEEVYYGKTRDYDFDPTTIETRVVIDENGNERIDTTNFGDIINSLNPGLASFREFSAGVRVSTQLFGKIKFGGRGLLGLQGIRHVIKPSVSLGYSPSYLDGTDYISGTRYFLSEQDINPNSPNDETFFSPFDNQIFGTPSRGMENLSLSYNIANLLEAKVWDKKDSTSNNIPLFQNIGISGSYSLNATDSLKWSQVRMSGSTSLFKRTSRLSLSATFDPYVSEEVERPYSPGGPFRALRAGSTPAADGFPGHAVHQPHGGQDPPTLPGRRRGIRNRRSAGAGKAA